MSYSSPFSKKFHAKSPMSPMDKALVGKQNRLPEHLQEAIKAAPEMNESPLGKHGDKFRKQARKLSEGTEQGDYDYENKKVVKLLEKAKKADASHSTAERTEEDMAQVRQDEDAAKGSAVEMSAIKKKSAPLNASYQNADDYHYVSNAADFQRLQDSIVSGAKAAMTPENIGNYQAKRVEKRENRKDKRSQTQEFKDKTARIKKRSDDNLSDDVTNPCYNMKSGTIIGQGSNQITCP